MNNRYLIIALMVGIAATGLALTADGLGDANVPETIVMDGLEGPYEAVNFPHMLHSEIAECGDCHHHGKESGLTNACSDCHGIHKNGTVSEPTCSSCHVTYIPERSVDVISLRGAYHQQCLACHYDKGNGTDTCTTLCHATRAATPAGGSE